MALLTQGEKDSGHDKRFFILSKSSVIPEIFMEHLRLFEYVGKLYVPGRGLSKHDTSVIFQDMASRKVFKGLDIGQYLIILFINEYRAQDVMLSIPCIPECKDFLEACVFYDPPRIKQGAVDSILLCRLYGLRDPPSLDQAKVRPVCLVLHDKHKILNDSNELRKTGPACLVLGGSLQGIVDFRHIASLHVRPDTGLREQFINV